MKSKPSNQYAVIRVVNGIVFSVTAILTLNACAPLVQSQSSSIQTPLLTENLFITEDGIKLPVKKWLPVLPPKVLLVALHGFNDYKNGFTLPGAYLAENGVATIAYDQRGFGDTPQRGIWPGRVLLERDVLNLIQLVRKEYPHTPIYLLGVSMGAAVALSTSVTYGDLEIEGLILVAPAVWGGESFNWFYRSALWLVSHMARWFLTGRGYVTLSDNVEMIKSFHSDPKVISSSRLDAVYGMSQLMDYVQNIAAENKKPVYLFYGLKDEVIPIEAVCALLGKLVSPFEARFYSEGYHFLLRDLSSELVWYSILQSITSYAYEDSLHKRISHSKIFLNDPVEDRLSSLIPSECNN